MRWQAIPAVKATAAGLVLAAAALAGAAAAQAAPSAASPSLALPGRLYGVAATSTTNASAKGYWAVGSTDWARTLVRHWNGKAPKIGAAQPAGSWGRAVEVPGLGALNKGGQAGVASVSCGSAGSCAAGGDYQNHGLQGFVVIERHGRWGQAIEVPGLGALNTGGYAQVASVSCAPAGSCAVGGYYSEPHSEQGFVASERNGRWGTAIAVPGLAALNTGSQAEVSSVSCGSAGSCAAGGYYSHGDLGRRGFVAVERDGVWGVAIAVPGLAALNKDDYAEVTSVSCASAGSCTAGGYYTYGGGNEQGFVAVERDGVWGTAIQVPGLAALNTGAGAGVSSVSCVPAGSCTAVGGYTDRRDHSLGFVAVERDGRWGKAIAVPGCHPPAAWDQVEGFSAMSMGPPGRQ